MDGGGAGPSRATGGEFLLSLLQKSNQSQTPPPQSLTIDPAVAAVGRTVPTQPRSSTNGHDLSSRPPPHSPWSHQSSLLPPNFFLQGFPQNPLPPPSGNHFPGHQFPGNSSQPSSSDDDFRRLGFHQSHKPEMMFGSLPSELQNQKGLSDGNHTDNSVAGCNVEGLLTKLEASMKPELGLGNGSSTGFGRNRQFESQVNSNPNSLNHQQDRRGIGNYGNREQNRRGIGNYDNREQDRRGNVNYVNREQDRRGNVNNDNREQDRRGNSRWGRQEHGVAHSSSHDGELGRQEHVVHRSSRDGGWSRQEHGVVHRSSQVTPRPPPGFPSNPRGGRNWDSGNRRRNIEQNVDVQNNGLSEFNNRAVSPIDEEERIRRGSPANCKAPGYAMQKTRLTDQFDLPGPPTGSNLHSVKASGIEESLLNLHAEIDEIANEHGYHKQDEMGIVVNESNGNKDKKKGQNSRDKYTRSDTRGNWLLSQKMRNLKRQMICRGDIDILNAPFLAIFESLIPAEDEKAKQKQLFTLLERLVSKEWPEAQLYLYGSCANSFDVSKSDIDVCLAIDDAEINKSDFLLRLAEILQSDNLQNVQALTRARVPIVKLMDPVTGISCDICINNVLAVVNTKLLRDYAQIDVRLRQLAFIVKHWAKSRGVNETYQGTLSSYAYVLMCIHFLQLRKPAVLPCLQGMEPTYYVTVDDVKCAYFDRVEKLQGFGSDNKENIAQLVWAFFNYWAYCHDYANTAISIRTGSIISKQSKDWTTRVGNDRHLICIEDPFQISHDLGRVVDKFSIKVLREEFERAAHIMQYDPNPCVKLFEPYVPEGRLLNV